MLAYSLADRKLMPVTAGVVPGGRVRVTSPYVIWSTMARENYSISARNLESGKTTTLTDERQSDAYDFLSGGRWVVWKTSRREGDTLNLLDIETGVSTVVSDVSFTGIEGNALLHEGRLFWLDDKSGKVLQFQDGVRKLAFEGGQVPCSLLGVDANILYYLTQRAGRCAAASGKSIIRYDLAGGGRKEVAATLSSPSEIIVGSGLAAWIDTRDGIDDVFAMSLKDGRERRVSSGFGHLSLLSPRAAARRPGRSLSTEPCDCRQRGRYGLQAEGSVRAFA